MFDVPGPRRASTALLIALFTTTCPSVSRADTATAQALFDAARELAEQGRYQEACPKFEESQRLDPGIGTLLNLADCQEHLERLATAWALFLETEALARRSGDARRADFAAARARALAPRLPRLRISPELRSDDLTITRDGSLVARAAWGLEVPLDPGPHLIEARAPGKIPWQTRVQLAADGRLVEVVIRPLEPATTGAPSPSPRERGTRRSVALGVAAGSLVSLGASLFLALRSKGTYDETAARCQGGCDDDAFDARVQARRQANVATGLGLVGVGLGAAAAYLWFWSPSPGARPGLSAAPLQGGAFLTGSGRF